MKNRLTIVRNYYELLLLFTCLINLLWPKVTSKLKIKFISIILVFVCLALNRFLLHCIGRTSEFTGYVIVRPEL